MYSEEQTGPATYITETGALISAHDYGFLSPDQQARCSPYQPYTIVLRTCDGECPHPCDQYPECQPDYFKNPEKYQMP